jgi:cell division protein FtsB
VRTLRFSGRLALAVVVLAVATVVLIEFGRIVARNLAISQQLAAERADIAVLREREQRQRREIRRLADPGGAVPEIHERLQLVGPREELIFVRGTPSPTSVPDDGGSAR